MALPINVIDSLGDLFDIDVRTNPPLDGQILVWDEASSKWIPANPGAATGDFSGSYLDLTNVPTEFNPSAHTHAIADIISLQSTLDGKAAMNHDHNNLYYLQVEIDGLLITHTHPIANIVGLQSALDGKANTGDLFSGSYDDLTNIPSTFTPSAHTHPISAVTNLQATLDGKAAVSHTHDYATLTNLPSIPSALNDLSDVSTAGATDGQSLVYNSGGWAPATVSSGGGVTDHGALTGLADDDHQQYLNQTRGDARYSQIGHTHDNLYYTESEVNALLAGKAGTGDVFSGSYLDLTNVPATFTPASHSHPISEITNLQNVLDGKAGTGDIFSGSYLDLVDVPLTFTPASHTHAAADITSGTFDLARIPTTLTGKSADQLDGQEGSYYLNYANFTGTPSIPSSLGDLSNVTITSIGDGELLQYSSGSWINRTLAEAGVAAASHTHAAIEITNTPATVTDTSSTDGNGNHVVIDSSTARIHKWTLGGNRQMAISGASAGTEVEVWIRQDATGGRTLSFGSDGTGNSIRVGSDFSSADIATGAEEVTHLKFVSYDGSRWHLVALTRGFDDGGAASPPGP